MKWRRGKPVTRIASLVTDDPRPCKRCLCRRRHFFGSSYAGRRYCRTCARKLGIHVYYRRLKSEV